LPGFSIAGDELPGPFPGRYAQIIRGEGAYLPRHFVAKRADIRRMGQMLFGIDAKHK